MRSNAPPEPLVGLGLPALAEKFGRREAAQEDRRRRTAPPPTNREASVAVRDERLAGVIDMGSDSLNAAQED